MSGVCARGGPLLRRPGGVRVSLNTAELLRSSHVSNACELTLSGVASRAKMVEETAVSESCRGCSCRGRGARGQICSVTLGATEIPAVAGAGLTGASSASNRHTAFDFAGSSGSGSGSTTSVHDAGGSGQSCVCSTGRSPASTITGACVAVCWRTRAAESLQTARAAVQGAHKHTCAHHDRHNAPGDRKSYRRCHGPSIADVTKAYRSQNN